MTALLFSRQRFRFYISKRIIFICVSAVTVQKPIEPGDWKYTENSADIAGASQDPESGFEKVTFDRFGK